jgi:hypothetical protein
MNVFQANVHGSYGDTKARQLLEAGEKVKEMVGSQGQLHGLGVSASPS